MIGKTAKFEILSVLALTLLLAVGAQAQTFNSGSPDCGPVLDLGDVQVVDVPSEDSDVQVDVSGVRMLDGAWRIRAGSSRLASVNAARRWAARNGCHLVILGPEFTEEQDLGIGMGSSSQPNSGPRAFRRYAPVRFGIRVQTD